jgi:hypothetical protein
VLRYALEGTGIRYVPSARLQDLARHLCPHGSVVTDGEQGYAGRPTIQKPFTRPEGLRAGDWSQRRGDLKEPGHLVQVSEVVDGLGRRPVNGRADRPDWRQCGDCLRPGRRVHPQPGPIVLESKGEEVPDLKDRSVEHSALLAVPLDVRR